MPKLQIEGSWLVLEESDVKARLPPDKLAALLLLDIGETAAPGVMPYKHVEAIIVCKVSASNRDRYVLILQELRRHLRARDVEDIVHKVRHTRVLLEPLSSIDVIGVSPDVKRAIERGKVLAPSDLYSLAKLYRVNMRYVVVSFSPHDSRTKILESLKRLAQLFTKFAQVLLGQSFIFCESGTDVVKCVESIERSLLKSCSTRMFYCAEDSVECIGSSTT